MLSHVKAFLLATALFFPVMANATPVVFDYNVGALETFSGAQVIHPGDSLEFRFKALANLMINAFSLSAPVPLPAAGLLLAGFLIARGRDLAPSPQCQPDRLLRRRA